jgi:hypothetical protein
MNKKSKKTLFGAPHLGLVIEISLLFFVSCNASPDRLAESLQLAGGNRPELEQVLHHYKQHEADSLKYRAAVFLIENMPYHCSYSDEQRLNQYYDRIDSALESCRNDTAKDVKTVLTALFSESPSSKMKVISDVKTVTSRYLIDNIDTSFDLWLNEEWATHVGFEDFCEYLLPYKIVDGQILDGWKSYLKPAFCGDLNTLHYCDLYRNLAYKACETVNQELKNELNPQIVPNGENMISIGRLSTLVKMPMGTCDDYCLIASSVMRSKGIPVGMDFTPQWPFRSMGHSWNILLDNTGKNVIFEGAGPVPGTPHKKEHKMAKVFRRTYAVNRELEAVLQTEKHVPPIFLKNRFSKDVTDEYMETQDVEIKLNPHGKFKYAYPAVFDNRNWIPVCWGKISGRKAVFRKMGKNIVYLPVYYGEEGLIPASDPFILTVKGEIQPVKADTTKSQTLNIRRKFPVFQHVYNVRKRVVGGKIQASHEEKFKEPVTLHEISEYGVRAGEIDLNDVKEKYRYWRYYSPEGAYCNMAELYFFDDESGPPLTGRIIGTSGSCISDGRHEKEAVFDNDPLTYFDAPAPSGCRVGMDFGEPVRISMINYVPRGDGNNIEIGDVYELFYWDRGWVSLGKQTANRVKLIYENCPTGALFFIHDHTKGQEERIFTYENGKQVWW